MLPYYYTIIDKCGIGHDVILESTRTITEGDSYPAPWHLDSKHGLVPFMSCTNTFYVDAVFQVSFKLNKKLGSCWIHKSRLLLLYIQLSSWGDNSAEKKICMKLFMSHTTTL